MKNTTRLLVTAAALAAMTLSAEAAPPAGPPGLPVPKILVIDRSALVRQSKAGQDMMRQVKAYTDAAEKDLRARGAALQAEGQALQQQVAILSADAKAKKVQAFDAKQAALQNLAQQKQTLIQGGYIKASQQLEQMLGPILQSLMQQRGANLLLDKNAVVYSSSMAFDITPDAINQLNQKLSTIKVDLVAPPPGTIPPAQRR